MWAYSTRARRARSHQQTDEISDDLAAQPETGEPKLDLSGVFHPGLRSRTRPKESFHPMGLLWGEGYTELLLFRDDSELPPDIRMIPGVRVEKVDGMVAVWMRPEAGDPGRGMDSLHTSGCGRPNGRQLGLPWLLGY
jgi:hypothetical protein